MVASVRRTYADRGSIERPELIALARAFVANGRRHTADMFGEHLTRYRTPSNYVGAEWPEFFPVYSHHRDSDHLTESNWDAIVRELGAVDALQDDSRVWTRQDAQPAAIIVREGNPFTGWGEWVGVQDNAFALLLKADALLERIAQYPVLNDEDLSRREWEDVERYWREMSPRERLDALKQSHTGRAFATWKELRAAIRSDEFPSAFDDSGSLFDRLRG